MKYIKSYEKINQKGPKKGDYILPHIKFNVDSEWSEFFNNTIGKINYVLTTDNETYDIVIYYKNADTPEEFKYIQLQPADKYEDYFQYILLANEGTFYFSPDKETLEQKLELSKSQKKYNL